MVCTGCGTPSASTETNCRSCGRRLPDRQRDVAAGVLTPVPDPPEPSLPGDETLMGAFAGNAQTAEWIPAGHANPGARSTPAVPPPSDDDAVTGIIPPPDAEVHVCRQSPGRIRLAPTMTEGPLFSGRLTPNTRGTSRQRHDVPRAVRGPVARGNRRARQADRSVEGAKGR